MLDFSAPKPLPTGVAENFPTPERLTEDVVRTAKQSVSGLRDFFAGGVGGIFSVCVGHPFDLVKVRLQTAETGMYNGAMDVVRKTVAREGVMRGLYAGISAPLVGVTPMYAVNFWGYGVGKQLVEHYSTVHNNQFTIAQTASAGAVSALPLTLITAPFERVKIILQIQGGQGLKPGEKPKYSGSADVVSQLYKEGGIRYLYRGSLITLARDAPGFATYFAVYETVKRKLTGRTEEARPAELSLTAICAAGGAAGIAMWTPVFPIDTVKSSMQSSDGHLGIGATIRQIYTRGGVRALFPGVGPAMARAVPANAATFSGVELVQQAMNNGF